MRKIKQNSDESEDEKPKKKVTINHRGKVKLPTDSISIDFEPFLTSSLTKGLDSTYHKQSRESEENNNFKRQKPEQNISESEFENSSEE